MLVSSQHSCSTPSFERPAHYWFWTMYQSGTKRRMMEIYYIVFWWRRSKTGFEPLRLNWITIPAVNFIGIRINYKKMYGTFYKIIIPFISRKSEISKIRPCAGCSPVVISEWRKKSVDSIARTVSSKVWINEFLIILSDIWINRSDRTNIIIIITKRNYKIRILAFYKISYCEFVRTCIAVVAYNCKVDRLSWTYIKDEDID